MVTIGKSAFESCSRLEKVTINENSNLNTIGASAFAHTNSLEGIYLPSSLINLGDYAFLESGLSNDVTIPSSLEYFGTGAFAACHNLVTLTILNKDCKLGEAFLIDAEFDEKGELIPVELKTVLRGYKNSTAQDYAELYTEAGYPIKFEALDGHVHTPVTYTQDATCTVNGYMLTTCAECTETLSYEVIFAPGHAEGEVIKENVVAATCTEAGSYDEVVYCTACTEELSRDSFVTDPLGHDFSIDVVVKEATLVSEGQGYKECSRCGKKENYTIPVLEGTISKDEKSDVSVEFLDGAYDGNMQVKVEEDFTGSQYLTQSYTKFESWNIKTYVDGSEVQPGSPVLVSIPLPTDYNQATVAVYHVNSMTGTLEKISPLYFENGYVKFIANSFSVYMLIDESSAVHNHKDDNHNGKCDGCDYDFTSDCSCKCHSRSFITKLIWKITILFNKILRKNKVCACGIYHY